MRRFAIALLVLAAVATVAAGPAAAQTKLLRFPDIHGDKVAFVYAGDIWTAPADGGRAVRLTTHPGLELFPKFSPDGKWIAFTGEYDGDEQVYVVPAEGGVPKQLTYYPANGPLPPRWGYDNQVYGWTADGQKVLFRSMRDGWDLSDTQLFLVDVDGGLPERLPMPTSGAGDLSPDGKQNRLLAADPRLPELEALPGRLGAEPLHLRPGHLREPADHRATRAPSGTRCGSATRSSSTRTRPARSTSTPTTSPPATWSSSPTPATGTCAGRAATTRARSSTSWAASSRSTTSPPARAGTCRSTSRPTPCRPGRARSRSPVTSRASGSRPRRRGLCSSPGATSSPCRSSTARCAT